MRYEGSRRGAVIWAEGKVDDVGKFGREFWVDELLVVTQPCRCHRPIHMLIARYTRKSGQDHTPMGLKTQPGIRPRRPSRVLSLRRESPSSYWIPSSNRSRLLPKATEERAERVPKEMESKSYRVRSATVQCTKQKSQKYFLSYR